MIIIRTYNKIQFKLYLYILKYILFQEVDVYFYLLKFHTKEKNPEKFGWGFDYLYIKYVNFFYFEITYTNKYHYDLTYKNNKLK